MLRMQDPQCQVPDAMSWCNKGPPCVHRVCQNGKPLVLDVAR